MSPLLWLKLKKYSKLENYIAFVQSTDLSKVPPLSRGDTDGLKRPDVPGLFTYLPVYDALRQKYALDTAVRGNTDFERALSVMQWLTDNTWYSGAQYHLLRDDPLQILDYAYRKPFKNAINCRFKAIVLSDLLQAFGIPAYPIAMLDANKNGNHLTVHVYLKEKKQWALFDPSFNTYFTGEDGVLFNAVTLRECFLSGSRPVIQIIPPQLPEKLHHHLRPLLVLQHQKLLKLPLRDNHHPLEVLRRQPDGVRHRPPLARPPVLPVPLVITELRRRHLLELLPVAPVLHHRPVTPPVPTRAELEVHEQPVRLIKDQITET